MKGPAGEPSERIQVGPGPRWGFWVAWQEGSATREEVSALVARRVDRHPLLGDARGPVVVAAGNYHARAELQQALERLPHDPRVPELGFAELVAAVSPARWHVVGHRVRLLMEAVLVRRGGDGPWALVTVPCPARGGRPSAWEEPVPIPYEELSAKQRRGCLVDAAASVGTLPEIVSTFLPDPEGSFPDLQEDPWQMDRRVASGHLNALHALLDMAPIDDSGGMRDLVREALGTVPADQRSVSEALAHEPRAEPGTHGGSG